MEDQGRLRAWFDRSREEDSGVPSTVTREDARNARQYLAEHSGFDFDRFEEGLQVERLLNAPLGETSGCLSAEEIAKLVGSEMAAASARFDPVLAGRAISHSENCDVCFDNIALYQELKNKSIERAIDNDVENLAPALSIGSVGWVEAAASGDPCLGLALTMYGEASDFNGMKTMHAQILGHFDTMDVMLHRVDPWYKRWLGTGSYLSLRPSRRPPARAVQAYYRTDALAELGQVSDQTCGFVSISQYVGGKEVLSRRVIRLERASALRQSAGVAAALGSLGETA